MRGLEQIPWLYDLGLWLAARGGFGRGDLAGVRAHDASPCVTSALRMAVPSGTKRVNGFLSTA